MSNVEEMVSANAVLEAYNKQVLGGSLQILFDLLDREHYQAAKDISPLVRNSLSDFDIPASGTVSDALVSTISNLVKEVSQLHALLTSVIQPAPTPAPVPEQVPVPEGVAQPTAPAV